ncbi:MAG: phosphatase PAP2 family protein [Actinomycetota bacterium]
MTEPQRPARFPRLRSVTRRGDAEELEHDRAVGRVVLTHWYSGFGRALASLGTRVGARLGARGALLLTLVAGSALALALSFVASRIYDAITESEGVAGLDRPLLLVVMRARTPTLDALVTGYTNLAGPIGMPVIAVAAIIAFTLKRRSWTPAILIVAGGLGSLLMTIAGKDIIGRVRPPLADAVPPYQYSPSFPSGHTLNAVVIAGVVAYLLMLRQTSAAARTLTIVVASLFAVTIGLSRVFLGLHWFTDVLAGWTLGAVWLVIIITSHRLYLTVRQRRAATTSPEPDVVAGPSPLFPE